MITDIKSVNPHIIPLLKEFRQLIIELYGNDLHEIILHGSHARGEERRDSDIDLAVILKKDIQPSKEITRINEKTYEIDVKYNKVLNFQPICLEKFESEPLSFFQSIKKEGIPI